PKGRVAAVAGGRIERADALVPGAVWAFGAASGTRLGRIDWDADGGLPAFHPTEPWRAVRQPDGAPALGCRCGQSPPRRIHPGGSALFSPRGTRLAAVGKEIVVYDTAAWKEVARRQGGAPICWAGEETLILRDGNALILWNPGANSERRLAPPGETPLATAPDGTISLWAADLGEAAWPDGARAARLRSLPDGALLGALQGARLPYLPYPARFSKRGDRLALPDPTDNTILRFFRVPGGAAAGSLKIPGLVFDVIQRGRFHPAGGRSGGYRWQAAREADRISPFRPITSPLARNGRALAASVFTSRPAVEIWDVDEGELIARLNDVTLPSWNRQGTRLACRAAGDSRGPGDEILFWRVRLPSPTLNIGAAIPRLLFGARSETLAADGDLLSLRTEAGEPRLELRSRFRNGHPIAPSARGGFWTVGERVDKGRPLLVLRREPGGKEVTPVPRRGAHWAVAIHPTELYALFAFSSPADAKPAWTNSYELWDLGRKTVAARWPQAAPGRAEGRLAYSPDGRWIASSCFASGGVELLRAADGSRLRLLKFPPRGEAAKPNAPKSPEDLPAPAEAIDFQFSPDGLLLLAAADDGTTCVWGVNSGRLLWAKTFAKEPPDALAVSPAESLAALAGPGDLIRLIYLRSGETAAQWRAGRMRIAALAFDSSGRYLAAAGDRGRVRLWDVGRLRRELARFGLAW
ncbi:MAG: WD40 repeat domain-containing protein, partial [Verrucomicrobia bacterium]|nr:WD40 repeat domain-containing protein [Verrucomicrobiota bacterium]